MTDFEKTCNIFFPQCQSESKIHAKNQLHQNKICFTLSSLKFIDWLGFLMKIISVFQDENITMTNSRQFIKKRLFFLPNDVSVVDANSRLLSFSFVRHPFARIVSAYNDQMIERPNWTVRKVLLEKVRTQLFLVFVESSSKLASSIFLF
jgi:hypothetical protein